MYIRLRFGVSLLKYITKLRVKFSEVKESFCNTASWFFFVFVYQDSLIPKLNFFLETFCETLFNIKQPFEFYVLVHCKNSFGINSKYPSL